jgi:hypothetical protein
VRCAIYRTGSWVLRSGPPRGPLVGHREKRAKAAPDQKAQADVVLHRLHYALPGAVRLTPLAPTGCSRNV